MPISDIVIAAIAVLATVAFALALAPTFLWVRRRIAGPGEQAREARAEGMLDPKAIERELGARSGTTAVDEPVGDAAAATPAADPTLEDRIIRIVSWAFLMAVAVFAAASGLWTTNLAVIVILIAVTGEILLVLQDVVPRTPLRSFRGPLQGVLALAFAGGIVALTGGFESPGTNAPMAFSGEDLTVVQLTVGRD